MQRVFKPAAGMLIRADKPPAVAIVGEYSELRDLMGGPIQSMRLTADIVAYVLEDAAHRGLPFNPVATGIAKAISATLEIDDFVVGPMILFGCINEEGEWDGYDYDCPAEVWQEFGGGQEEPENVVVHSQGFLFDCR